MLGGGPWLDDDARFESCPKLLLRAPDSGSASRRVFAFVGAEAVASGEVEAEGVGAELLFKLEFFNPLASVKDRIGLAMILGLEAEGKLKPGGTLITSTINRTQKSYALAIVAAEHVLRWVEQGTHAW